MTFLKALIKPIGLAACLYFFICSLDTMSSSFRLIAGLYIYIYKKKKETEKREIIC